MRPPSAGVSRFTRSSSPRLAAEGSAEMEESAAAEESSAAEGSSLLVACESAPLRFVMLVEAPALLGFSSLSCLDGYAAIAYGWEPEAAIYARLLMLPAAAVAVGVSTTLMRSALGIIGTMRLGLGCLLCALGLLCIARTHASLLYASMVLAGSGALALLPMLRLLGDGADATQQGRASASLLAVAHVAKAAGLAAFAYLFESAAKSGWLAAPFAAGAACAALALSVTCCCTHETRGTPQHAPQTKDHPTSKRQD